MIWSISFNYKNMTYRQFKSDNRIKPLLKLCFAFDKKKIKNLCNISMLTFCSMKWIPRITTLIIFWCTFLPSVLRKRKPDHLKLLLKITLFLFRLSIELMQDKFQR